MKKIMKYYILAFVCFILLTLNFCSKSNVKKNEVVKNEPGKKVAKEYLKEGFLSPGLFRVVIISTKNECEENIDYIEKKSKRRALLSLQKYMSSANCSINKNSNTKLLRLIQNNGKFLKQKINGVDCDNSNVFYYDIQKNNIKAFLVNLSYY